MKLAGLTGRVTRALPRGHLPDELWEVRHRWMSRVLWAHVPLLALCAVLIGAHETWHDLMDVIPVASFVALMYVPMRRRLRSAVCAAGLLTCSAVLVHITGGLPEAHFHFFVVIAALALYEDWWSYGLAFAYVGIHHGVMGAVDPESVFYHPGVWSDVSAWQWTVVHTFFIGCAAAANIVAWRLGERFRLRYAAQARRAAHAEAVAETLRQSILPDALPHVSGLRLHARYLPGDGTVGGDFYEVVELCGGSVMIAIGDVAGHGVPAAALTAKLRHTLTAHARTGQDPAWILQRLDELCVGMMATVALLVISADRRSVTYTRAGHPPPLLRHPDGTVDPLDAALTPPLAAIGAPRDVTAQARLHDGATLLLYTDGLVERRDEALNLGIGRLSAAAAELDSGPRLVEALPARMHSAQAGTGDDVALLCVEVRAVQQQRERLAA